MTDMIRSVTPLRYHSLVIITTSYSILINDVMFHYLTPYTYNLVQLLTILISYCATIAQYVLFLSSWALFWDYFHPLMIVSSTCTNNTLDVFKLGPYDPKY